MARQVGPSWRKGKRNSNDSLDPEQATDDVPTRRAPAEQGRYRLQVDRQTKGSYPTREAAMEAGLAIKRAYPILHVAVFDAEEGQSELIALTPA
ncbi:MAG: hypothetical protein JO134_06020 [Xanthobacteraceae bacterium]|nr:hypothetical protein [Xanthobacteraceae bacterium]